MCVYKMFKKRNLLFKRKPDISVKRENVDKYLAEQKEKDKSLIKKSKEVLFLGQSNIGKSSLINKILQKDVCRISKHPVV